MNPRRPWRWLGPLATALLPAPRSAAAVITPSPPLPDCVVPDLSGKTVPQLEYHRVLAGLQDGNPTHYCRLGQVKTRGMSRPARLRPLVIVSQTPRPGARVAFFTPISVVVAPAPAPRRPSPCHLVAGEEAVAGFPGLLVHRSFADALTAGGGPFFAHDSSGTRLLDQAPGTDIAALRLSAGVLAWTRSGVLQTARLA